MKPIYERAASIIVSAVLFTSVAWGPCCGVALAQEISPISSTLPTDTGQFNIRIWTTADGLPVNHIMQILQTQDGYLWIATGGGLVRFDGLDFRVFTTGDFPGWTTSFVNQLYESRDGALWFSSLIGELARYKDGQFTSFFREDGSPVGEILDWLELEAGAVWIATRTGAVRVQDRQVKTFTTRDGLPSNYIVGLGQHNQGVLTVATDVALARLEKDRFVAHGPSYELQDDASAYLSEEDTWWLVSSVSGLMRLRSSGDSLPVPDALKEVQITQMQQDVTGKLWVNSWEGLFTWKDGVLERFMPPPDFSHEYLKIQAVFEDRLFFLIGRLSYNALFGRFAEGRFTTEDLRQYLDYEAVSAIAEGKEGDLWVGTTAGLLHLTPRKVRAFSRQQALSHPFVFPIYQGHDGSIWIGTHGGGLNRIQDGQVTVFDTDNGFSSDFIRALHEDHAGNLWVGTNKGVSMLRGSKILNVSAIPWVKSPMVYSIHEDSQNRLWVGGEHGLYVLEYDVHGVHRARRIPQELRQVRDIHEDRQGRLWATAQNGLFSLEGEQWRKYTMQDGLSSDFLVSIYEEQDGTLWFSTYGNGINRLKDSHFFVYTAEHGLHSDGVWRILEDDHGTFWMASDKGLFRVSKKELDDVAEGRIERITSVVYTEADGMPSAECTQGGWRMRDGQLWFATIKGIAIVDPDHMPINTQPPPVHVETAMVDGVPIDLTQAPHLPPGSRNLEFRYAALSFVAPEKNQHRYKLEGYDEDWVEAGIRRVAYYTNLEPGPYTFRVIAANNDGIWNEVGDAVHVHLRPYFSQTRWFTLLIIGLLATGLAGVYWLRKQHLLLLFERERRRIADDLHDDIGSNIGSLALFLDYVSKKGRLEDEDRQQLQEHAFSARQLAQDIRDTVWTVNAGQDHLPALLDRMRQIAQRMLPTCAVRFVLPVVVPEVLLDMTWRRNVFLVYKEALHNAARHAQATQVDVCVALHDDVLAISVEDNGTGFEVETVRQGRGLQTMRARAEQVGGTLTIESQQGEGTTVRLQVKLD